MCMYLSCDAPETVIVTFEEEESARFCDEHLEQALKAEKNGFVSIVSVAKISDEPESALIPS
jgi:hypothetical protein